MSNIESSVNQEIYLLRGLGYWKIAIRPEALEAITKKFGDSSIAVITEGLERLGMKMFGYGKDSDNPPTPEQMEMVEEYINLLLNLKV